MKKKKNIKYVQRRQIKNIIDEVSSWPMQVSNDLIAWVKRG